jgi:flagellar FliL protein
MSQADELPAPKKKKSKLKWIILLLLILGGGGGGFAAYHFGLVGKFFSSGGQEADSAGNGSATEGGSTRITTPTSTLNTATFDPFVVNVADIASSRFSTLRVTIDVEVLSPAVIKELSVQNPRIRNAMIMLLSSKTSAELATPAGKLLLQNEVLDRINQVLGGSKVTRVFFTQFTVE